MTQIGQDVPNHLMFNEEIFENLPPSLSLIFIHFFPCPVHALYVLWIGLIFTNRLEQDRETKTDGSADSEKETRLGGRSTERRNEADTRMYPNAKGIGSILWLMQNNILGETLVTAKQ